MNTKAGKPLVQELREWIEPTLNSAPTKQSGAASVEAAKVLAKLFDSPAVIRRIEKTHKRVLRSDPKNAFDRTKAFLRTIGEQALAFRRAESMGNDSFPSERIRELESLAKAADSLANRIMDEERTADLEPGTFTIAFLTDRLSTSNLLVPTESHRLDAVFGDCLEGPEPLRLSALIHSLSDAIRYQLDEAKQAKRRRFSTLNAYVDNVIAACRSSFGRTDFELIAELVRRVTSKPCTADMVRKRSSLTAP